MHARIAFASGEQPPISSPASRRLLRDHHPLTRWLQWAVSICVVLVTLKLAAMWFGGDTPVRARYVGAIAVLLMFPMYRFFGVFQRFSGVPRGLLRLSIAWWATVLVLMALLLVIDVEFLRASPMLGVWVFSAHAGQLVVYLLFFALMEYWHRGLHVNLPSLVVGSGWLAQHLTYTLNGNAFIADEVVGIVDDRGAEAGREVGGVPVLGGLDELDAILDAQPCDRVYIALPMHSMHETLALQSRLLRRNLDVIWVPDIFSMHLINPSVREVGGLPLIALSESPLISGPRAYFKALMDVSLALLALILLSPLFLAVALAIKVTSPGPVFFRQPREGWDGEIFEIYKFRSMYVHQEEGGAVTQAHEGDRRITRVGRLIRRTSIDELPQLFNVLNGSMSLVGPRPHALVHNQEYSGQINAYLARHRIKPGITGWAQIHGYRGETRTVEDMEHRIQYDLEYINRWSLLLDCWILFCTPFALLRHRGV
ncbi:MAG: undecaprenyl-phosphate glucose phosphotransferase [Pseudomonadales bacterium]|nr:undecaprenyl-phosphate glucose phosphotransferase [Pseudomonadales bacterium]